MDLALFQTGSFFLRDEFRDQARTLTMPFVREESSGESGFPDLSMAPVEKDPPLFRSFHISCKTT
ncbi:MAG: hypothetical protein CMI21_03715 [Opitutae bacterium]|nr:hypothetical protein [Opitutae bacterium]